MTVRHELSPLVSSVPKALAVRAAGTGHVCDGTERGQCAEQSWFWRSDPLSSVADVREIAISVPIVGVLCLNVNSDDEEIRLNDAVIRVACAARLPECPVH